jgi:putative lipoprotein (rSAM/lipoprotein system)
MRKVEIIFLKSYNAIIAGLLAVLGFASSCDIKSEYGTPNAKFIVNGSVESSVTNAAIKNIRVIMQRDTAISDSEGKYTVFDKWGFPVSQTYNIQLNLKTQNSQMATVIGIWGNYERI